jgi:hypothetical protein
MESDVRKIVNMYNSWILNIGKVHMKQNLGGQKESQGESMLWPSTR